MSLLKYKTILKQITFQIQENQKYQGQCRTQGGCFLANTPIKMADGSYKNIQDILVGDNVFAFDINANIPTTSGVSITFVRPETRYRVVEYETKN